jgi:hypothetical protein
MAFELPTRWYRETAEEAIDTLTSELGPLTPATAWRFLYACVAWTEEFAGARYLHLNDRMSTKAGRSQAERALDYLKKQFSIKKSDPLGLLDFVGRRYDDERHRQGFARGEWQRNNVTGNAFEASLQVLVHRINGVLPARTPSLNTLRGFELAPSGYHSRPDLALFSASDFRVVISTKWTLRKERIGTYLHEAYFYKQRRPDLQIAFVVGEFNLNILEWLVNDPLVDRVYHIHLPLLLHVHRPFPEAPEGSQIPLKALLAKGREREAYGRWLALSEKLFDLEQLFGDIALLKRVGEGALPPDPDAPDNEAEEPGDGA